MESGDVQYLRDKEGEFVRILTGAGVRKPDSRVLVFLAPNPGTTAKKPDFLFSKRQEKLTWTHTAYPRKN